MNFHLNFCIIHFFNIDLILTIIDISEIYILYKDGIHSPAFASSCCAFFPISIVANGFDLAF